MTVNKTMLYTCKSASTNTERSTFSRKRPIHSDIVHSVQAGTLVLDVWVIKLGNKTGFRVYGQSPLLLHLHYRQIHHKPTVPTAHYVPYAKKI